MENIIRRLTKLKNIINILQRKNFSNANKIYKFYKKKKYLKKYLFT